MALADLANDVVDRHLRIVENKGARRRAFQAHFVFFGTGRHAGIVFLDNEATELLSVNLGERDEHVGKSRVRDPHLFAVDDPMRSIRAANRVRLCGQRVRTAGSLRKRVCGDLFGFAQ